MKRVFKRIGFMLLLLIGLLGILLLVSVINHQFQLSREDAVFHPVGQLVEVEGHSMNVYSEGDGDRTLVFLSGGGTCSPVLDFKSLTSLLREDYRVAVVEKIGYGFSENADVSRDISSILSGTREALKQAGVPGPYVLCPHSMSGIEALYWAQEYPEEVSAVIGLDMAVPQAYEGYEFDLTTLQLGAFAARAGLTRWIPGLAESSAAIQYGTLTDAEKELYKAVFYRRTATPAMLNETRQIGENASIVAQSGAVEVPMLLFSSNGEGTGWEEEEWRNYLRVFAQENPKRKLIELDCSHYVHDVEYTRIAREVRTFLNTH